MILFQEDWKKYPRAIIDLKTRNHSFVRLASVYREMGIQNNAFILALINPDLQGVDPFDPHLSLEEKLMIAQECKLSPFYHLREVARAPAIAGTEPAMVEANRGIIAVWWCFFNHITTYLIQIRQTGKSFSVDELMTYLMNVICDSTQINLLTKDDDLRRANIARLKEIRDELPSYLNPMTREDANNGEELTVTARKNIYKTHVPQASLKRAYNLGRGLTSPIMHIDEGPFQINIRHSLPVALSAMNAAIEWAKRNASPYGILFTTTAGKIDDPDGGYVYNLVCNAMDWTERLYDALNQADLERIVRAHSKNRSYSVNITLDHRQLGKSDQWLREALERSGAQGDAADRDYFNRWTSGSMLSPFSTDLADAVGKSRKPPVYTDISKPHGYITRWYIPEGQVHQRLLNSSCILGMDPSDAGGGDDISLIIMDAETAEVLAAGAYNETNLIVFSEWIASIFCNYPRVTGIIERRSSGAAILDYLLLFLPKYDIDPFKRLFNRVVNDADEQPERFREISGPIHRRPSNATVMYKKHFGFATSGSGITSRTDLYSTTLLNGLKLAGVKMNDKQLIDQTLGLVTKNGRIDHADGQHDDLVIGWLLCHWLLSQGKNLSFYGLDPAKILQKARTEKPMTREERLHQQEQAQIRERINTLYQQLADSQDEYVGMRLESQLRALDRQVINEHGEVLSVDQLINEIREMKRNQRRGGMGSRANSIFQQPGMQASRLSVGHYSDEPLSAHDYFKR